MIQIVVRLLASIIELFWVTYSVSLIYKKSYRWRSLIACILLYLPNCILLDDNEWKAYIIKNMCLFIIILIYLLKNSINVFANIPLICMLLIMSNGLKILAGILSGLITVFISVSLFLEPAIVGVLSTLFLAISVWGVISIYKRSVINLKFTFFKKCMAYFIYILIVCVKIPFLYTDLRDAYTTKLVFLSILCCTVIFLIISRIDKHNAEKERAKIEENNKKLSTKLHKSQEILPAMVQVLSNVTEKGGMEMETQEAQELLEEVSDLYGRQLKENSKEDLQLKTFCSTGLKILDQQLKVYQMEAIDRNVNLDIFVQAPINDLIKGTALTS